MAWHCRTVLPVLLESPGAHATAQLSPISAFPSHRDGVVPSSKVSFATVLFSASGPSTRELQLHDTMVVPSPSPEKQAEPRAHPKYFWGKLGAELGSAVGDDVGDAVGVVGPAVVGAVGLSDGALEGYTVGAGDVGYAEGDLVATQM